METLLHGYIYNKLKTPHLKFSFLGFIPLKNNLKLSFYAIRTATSTVFKALHVSCDFTGSLQCPSTQNRVETKHRLILYREKHMVFIIWKAFAIYVSVPTCNKTFEGYSFATLSWVTTTLLYWLDLKKNDNGCLWALSCPVGIAV